MKLSKLTGKKITAEKILDTYAEELPQVRDPRSVILTLHLLTEYWINRLIEQKCPTGKDIVKDNNSYPYAVKLTLVYSMKLIPKGLFGNLKRLNSIRNGYAHNLDYHLWDEVQSFVDQKRRLIFKGWGSIKVSLARKDAFGFIGDVTFLWLHKHCIERHRLSV
jgi:hypothetical protein